MLTQRISVLAHDLAKQCHVAPVRASGKLPPLAPSSPAGVGRGRERERRAVGLGREAKRTTFKGEFTAV